MAYCNWRESCEENIKYHDEEWGVPLNDDQKQFEFLMLEIMQCGLNWNLIIRKREIFRKCFDNFDFDKIVNYTENDINRVMNTPKMIKSRRKIEAVINNARCFQKIRKEFGSFCNYIWKFSEGKTIIYEKHGEGWIPVSNGLSDKISRDLKKRGFKFLGTITVYSHLQACGIINDHSSNCVCYEKINANHPTINKKRYLEKQVKYYGDTL